MRAPAGGPKGRAARWRKGNDVLLARLSGEQIASLRRAAAGSPPAFILGWHAQPDTGDALEPPLQAIEEIAREMLRSYDWPVASGEREWPPSGFVDQAGFENWRQVGPDWRPDPARSRLRYDRGSDRVCPQYDDQGRRFEDRPDFRHELLSLIQLVTELRAAVTGGHGESAILRAMTIGALFTRVAVMVLSGAEIAASAGARGGRDGAKASREDGIADSRSACAAALRDCDAAVTAKNRNLRSRSARAEKIEPHYAAWARENEEKPLSVRQIRRKLPALK